MYIHKNQSRLVSRNFIRCIYGIALVVVSATAFAPARNVQAEMLFEVFEEILSFGSESDSSQSDVLANETNTASVFMTDKSIYQQTDIITFVGALPTSAVAVYHLDNESTVANPDPESRPVNVFAADVGIDGSLNMEAVLLQPGRYTLVNTTDPGNCGQLYLAHCQAHSSHLGSVDIVVQ